RNTIAIASCFMRSSSRIGWLDGVDRTLARACLHQRTAQILHRELPKSVGLGSTTPPRQMAGMRERTGGKGRPCGAVGCKRGDSLRDLFGRRRDEKAGPAADDRVGNAANLCRYAGQARGSGLQIDQAESFHPARGLGQAGEAEEIAGAIDIADLFIGKRAKKAHVAIGLCRFIPQLCDIVGFALRPDQQPGKPLAQLFWQSAKGGYRQQMPLAPSQPRDRDHQDAIGANAIRRPRGVARRAVAEPEPRYAERYRVDTLGVDRESPAEQLARITAVGGDHGPRTEYAGHANGEALE